MKGDSSKADNDTTVTSNPDAGTSTCPSHKYNATLSSSESTPKHQVPSLVTDLLEQQQLRRKATTTAPEHLCPATSIFATGEDQTVVSEVTEDNGSLFRGPLYPTLPADAPDDPDSKQKDHVKKLEPEPKQQDFIEKRKVVEELSSGLDRLHGQTDGQAIELCGSLPQPLPTQATATDAAQPGAFAISPFCQELSDIPCPPIHYLPSSDNPETSSPEISPRVPPGSGGLVEANPVLSDDAEKQIPHASPLDAASQKLPLEGNGTIKEAKQAHAILASIVVAVLIAGLVLGLVFGLLAHDRTDSLPILSSPVAPSMAPTSSFILELLPSYSQEAIHRDPDSAQAKAYKWLLDDPNIGNYTSGRLLQRYALATFFLSTGGSSWFVNGNNSKNELPQMRQRPPMKDIPPPTHQYAWLNYYNNSTTVHECEWYNLNHLGGKETCNDLQEYINLELPINNLQGSLPKELALLTSMESLALHRNKLRGTMPTELFRTWGKIKDIMLLRNSLSGGIPSELGLWHDNLQRISLQNNDFSGSLPLEVWQLSRLSTFHIRFNSLTGSIPADIGKMESLGSIEFEGNRFHSGLPTEIALASSLFRLQFSSDKAWTLPSHLARLTKLAYLTLDSANLNGTIPSEIALLSNLQRLSLNDNPLLVGSIPASLGLLPSPLPTNQTPRCPAKDLPMSPPRPPQEELSLEQVSIKGTGLSGSLPVEWCSSLKILCFDCSNSSQSLCGCSCPCPD